ncbi:MAG: segregation/condensation protein A [Clostridiales bacterium]|nr:segregation/condensation protein A [Clostridiales bacterium]
MDFKIMSLDPKYENFESVVDYDTVLDDFEGPLDLLLHLININKINIDDIFVSKVTEQFLDYIEYMKTQPSRDVDKESEYLAMAAQIIYIKSKSLVPPVEIDGEEIGGAEDEQQELIEQLKQREFELIKERTPKLKSLETVGYFFKEPDKEISKVKIVYKDFSVDAMLQAFANLLLRNESMQREKENIKEIPKDEYTVQERVVFIRELLLVREEFNFEELFASFSRNEVITTFQALLEMLKFQYVLVEQPDTFGNITIKRNPDADLKDVNNEQFDEYN